MKPGIVYGMIVSVRKMPLAGSCLSLRTSARPKPDRECEHDRQRGEGERPDEHAEERALDPRVGQDLRTKLCRADERREAGRQLAARREREEALLGRVLGAGLVVHEHVARRVICVLLLSQRRPCRALRMRTSAGAPSISPVEAAPAARLRQVPDTCESRELLEAVDRGRKVVLGIDRSQAGIGRIDLERSVAF